MNESLRTGALYIRVSTHEQEELSPDAQKRLLLDYAKSNNIIVPSEYIYMDGGISGRKAEKRPQFQNMIAKARSKEHPFDVILVWKFSRFARNQEESIVYKSMLKRDNVEVVSITEPLVDGPFGSLIERIIEWMDEYYSIRLTDEVIRGMTEKALRGGYQATSPLGYSKAAGGIPKIDETEAEIVRRIFAEYLNGVDFVAISRHLNELGYRTRRGYFFDLRGVRYILQNPFYIGKVRWNRAKHSSYTQNPDDEIIIADGKHEPIISIEDFEAVQERIKCEFRPIRRKGISYSKHWLCGIIKCGKCNSNLSLNKNNNTLYFQCYKYSKGQHKGSCAITINKAANAVLNALNECIMTGNIEYQYIQKRAVSDDTLMRLKKSLSSLDIKENRIKIAYSDGIDSLDEYKENKTRINKERENLLRQIAEIENSNIVDYESLKPQLLNRCKTVYELLISDASIEEKSASFRSICESVTYDRANQQFDIVFYVS